MDKETEKQLRTRIAELELDLEQAKIIMEAQHQSLLETQPTHYYEEVGYALGAYNVGDDGIEQPIVVKMPLMHGLELYAKISNH
jgi:hypothetical protein